MNKEDIEKTLQINGVSITDGDDVIRQSLLSARYKEEEIKEALQLLKQTTPPVANKSKVDGLHKLFRTNGSLGPEEISKLLNIEIRKDSSEGSRMKIQDKRFSSHEFVLMGACSVLLAIGGMIFYMYLNDTGVFHPVSVLSLKS